MTSLDTLIVKVASRCNLACTYCYEYFAGDDSWKSAPKAISAATLKELGGRIQEYCAETGTPKINVVLHGGEPLLLGAKRLDAVLTTLRASTAPAKIRYSVQTNGTLLTREICDVLRQHEVFVGVSLDGDSNAKRVDLKGEPTLRRVAEGIDLLKTHSPHLFAGILCVIDLETDPIKTLASLCSYGPPEIDLLYPFVTHDHAGPDRQAMAMKFGRWMIGAMKFWIAHPEFSEIKIRVFEDALQSTVSQRPQTDWFGSRNISYLVVETSGNYDLLDQLKVIGTESLLYRNLQGNVRNSSLKEAASAARALLEKSGGHMLPDGCVGCRWSAVCAGSHLPARHSLQRGFNNRSVYCEGLLDLLDAAHDEMLKYKDDNALPDLRGEAALS